MANKMTYVDALTFAIENLTNDEVVEKLTALREQTMKRNTSERKPTKVQVENERLKALVLEALGEKPQTVTEFMATSAELSTLSNQKVSALVNALVKEGKALKVPDGRKTTFCRLA